MVASDQLYLNFMSVKAHDNDCTNEGDACSYKLVPPDSIANLDTNENIEAQMPFKIDGTGSLSSTRPLIAGKIYDFKVRAFDCISKESFVDAQVHIEIIDRCSPQWIGRRFFFTIISCSCFVEQILLLVDFYSANFLFI
jgi:hypothetical protein